LTGSIAFARANSAIAFAPPQDCGNNCAISLYPIDNSGPAVPVDGPEPGHDYHLNRFMRFHGSEKSQLLVGATIATAGDRELSANLMIYDTVNWHSVAKSKILPGISSLSLFGGGKYIAIGQVNTGNLTVVDSTTGDTLTEISAAVPRDGEFISISSVAGSPNGELVFAGTDSAKETARIIKVGTGEVLASLTCDAPPIRKAEWDPDGRYVAFVDNDSELYLWSPWAGNQLVKIALHSKSMALAISPDGQRIAVALDQGVRVFSVK